MKLLLIHSDHSECQWMEVWFQVNGHHGEFLVTAHMAVFPQPQPTAWSHISGPTHSSPVYACALPEAPSPEVNEGNFATQSTQPRALNLSFDHHWPSGNQTWLGNPRIKWRCWCENHWTLDYWKVNIPQLIPQDEYRWISHSYPITIP